MIRSYYEATARERIDAILDARSFRELMPPTERVVSPHLQALSLPVAFDDGVVVGRGAIEGREVLIAAQEGGFMGGAVGEVHGAKIVGVLQRAIREHLPVVLLVESGGVRLQEANAGLIAVSEVMRAILAARSAGVPVVAAIGGQYGCFGGMGIAVSCSNAIVMSEEGRLGLSGPEVIETAHGVEEFDSHDRALVWRTVGGKHRYLLGDCMTIVDDEMVEFRGALAASIEAAGPLTLETVEAEHAKLSRRLERFGDATDGEDVWRALGWADPAVVPLADTDVFLTQARLLRAA
ncbi:MAG TPA: biotin-independent malonate decarboxylase subunit beta [Casimicrobiaceae bacterium]|jgi:malonate decarboxylase beta subunit|nr:biotin-independent malonate decarboxylase subunit beta [Casimicrobiaceae bacterium]